ncbi:MAG TPA: hypothetical protein VGD59_04545 [Acidisarcina sp.]
MAISKVYLTAVALLTVGLACVANAQTEKDFPADHEVVLVLTQTERAIQQYKPLIDQEEIQIGKGGADAAATDRQLVSSLEKAVKTLKVEPQGFNGPLGFAFFEWLDDASRNAALCASSGSSHVAAQLIAGDTSKASSLLHLAQSCNDVSTLIYTVSENAGSLYQQYVEAEQQLAAHGAQVAATCADILKKKGTAPKR